MEIKILCIFACTAKMQELLLIDFLLIIILQRLFNRPVLVLRLSFGPNILYDQWQKDTSNRFLNLKKIIIEQSSVSKATDTTKISFKQKFD